MHPNYLKLNFFELICIPFACKIEDIVIQNIGWWLVSWTGNDYRWNNITRVLAKFRAKIILYFPLKIFLVLKIGIGRYFLGDPKHNPNHNQHTNQTHKPLNYVLSPGLFQCKSLAVIFYWYNLVQKYNHPRNFKNWAKISKTNWTKFWISPAF